MTARERWSVAGLAQRAGYIVAIIGALTATGGAVVGMDAWAGARVTTIVEREVPEAVDRAIGTELDDVRTSQRLVLERIGRLSDELSGYHRSVSEYRERVDEMERKLEERLEADREQ